MKERMRVLSYRIMTYKEAMKDCQSSILTVYMAECLMSDAAELAYLVSCTNVAHIDQARAA